MDPHGIGTQQGDDHGPLQLDHLTVVEHRATVGADGVAGLPIAINLTPGLAGLGQALADVVAGLRARQRPGGTALGILLAQIEGTEQKGFGGLLLGRGALTTSQ